jgi:predicted DNA-binding transcriptional regulator YafY
MISPKESIPKPHHFGSERMTMTDPNPTPIQFSYKNWRGETSMRTVLPIKIWWGKTDWHPHDQWLLKAFDMDKEQERDFALTDIAGIDLKEKLSDGSNGS